MKKSISTILPLVLSAFALVLALSVGLDTSKVQAQLEGVTNYNGIHLSQSTFGTATPQFEINNDGSNQSFRILDSGGTPEVYVDADGGMTINDLTSTAGGNVDLNGNDLIIDTDGDSVLDENTDDAIRLTLGAASGTFSTLTGNFKVGNGSPSVTQNGEDAYVEGQFEVDGEGQFDGGIDSNGIIDQDGAADAVQLAVTGYTTQTNDLVQLDGGLTDIGGGTYANADGDNDLGIDGDLEVNSNAYVDTDLTIDDTLNIDDTDSALTGAQTITPTYSYLQVSPTAVLTVTLGVPTACDGDLFIIHNLVTTSTVVVDTGATVGGGNITMAQDDLAGFICGDGVWVELFSPDNS